MDNLKTRLLKFIDYAQMGQTKFELSVGISRGIVSKIKANISSKTLNKISEVYPELNTTWLLTGAGEMLKIPGSENQSFATIRRDKGTIRYWVDIDATGGGIIQFGDSDTNRFIDLRIPEFGDCTDAINLYGDSMAPRYKSGQIIILKEWRENFIDFGNVYVVTTKSGNRMVKVLRAVKDSFDTVLCVSYNPEFDPFVIAKEDILSLYIVKGSIEKSTL